MKVTHQVTTLVPVIKRMGESQGFSAGRFVIRRWYRARKDLLFILWNPLYGTFVRWNRGRAECLALCPCCPEGSVWRYSMCCVSSGFCIFERVGMRRRECSLTPDPPDYPLASGVEKYRAFLPVLPTPLTKSHSEGHFSHHIPNTQLYSFLAEDQEKWVFTWEGFCLLLMVLVTPHVRVQPSSSSQAHGQGTHWLLSHTDQPAFIECAGYTHFTKRLTNSSDNLSLISLTNWSDIEVAGLFYIY